MSEFVTLACPSCGGKLEITKDIDRFACGHCGREHLVKRSGGMVSLDPILQSLQRVEAGVGKTASELAIVRLQKEISELQAAKRALLESHPKPSPSPLFVFPLAIGCISLFIGGISILDNGFSMTNSFLLFGFVLFMIGVVPLVFLRPNTKPWESTIGVQVQSLDRQISEKNRELQKNNRVVSS